MTQLVFTSQIDFIDRWNKEPPSSSVCISITDRMMSYKPYIDPNWKESLALEFFDFDSEKESEFTNKHAKQICEFVDKISSMNLQYIVVHCFAGISRSAAVANFISCVMNLQFPDHYMLYNKYVFRTLMNYWNINYLAKGEESWNLEKD